MLSDAFQIHTVAFYKYLLNETVWVWKSLLKTLWIIFLFQRKWPKIDTAFDVPQHLIFPDYSSIECNIWRLKVSRWNKNVKAFLRNGSLYYGTFYLSHIDFPWFQFKIRMSWHFTFLLQVFMKQSVWKFEEKICFLNIYHLYCQKHNNQILFLKYIWTFLWLTSSCFIKIILTMLSFCALQNVFSFYNKYFKVKVLPKCLFDPKLFCNYWEKEITLVKGCILWWSDLLMVFDIILLTLL